MSTDYDNCPLVLCVDVCRVDCTLWPSTLSTVYTHTSLQARVHGLSERQMRRLAEFDSARRQELVRDLGRKDYLDSVGSGLEDIPSVPTMEQLPYLSVP